ncbi:ABC transporter permease [Paenibacillus eucommiae]|uniref:Aldouronate transport system permease protein n=1 Tax=Paenibacillus eucommiae TaxID=1355755 RepID=A0ABS4IV02_9BACL|nr:ABC transporter permease subunit [Paenibacillus eucommiae]MBP1990404.1 putative aldouronate transport system permease protein [Paenibacillus eucommiae]
MSITQLPLVHRKKAGRTWRKLRQMKALYLLMLLPAVFVFIFNYMPLYGVLIAFKDFNYSKGILGSDWNQFAYFKSMLNDSFFRRALWNTIRINLLSILIIFPAPIIFALLLNEMKHLPYKRVVQTISYLPHFMSWVVIGGFVYQLLSPEGGIVNALLGLFGIEPIYFMTNSHLFIPVLLSASIWQGVGWGSIIYLAAISGIDPTLYESAEIDGAGRWQKVFSITIPAIMPAIIILFILSLSSILNAGFDPIFNLYNPLVMNVADVIDTYVYRKGLLESKFGYAAAVGLFQSLIGLLLVYFSNRLIKKFSDYGIW